MIKHLIEYLKSLGFDNLYVDFFPESADYTALLCWDHIPDITGAENGERHIQIKVRRGRASDALKACEEITKVFDPGQNEDGLDLTGFGRVYTRIKRLPILLERGENYAIYYSEITIWN